MQFIKKLIQLSQTKSLYAFLNDESFAASERLRRLVPRFAYFAFAFSDLMRCALNYPAVEAKSNRFKKAINAHCAEDSTHWPWFLTDLKTLDLNKEIPFTSAIRYLWGKTNKGQRWSCYELAILANRAIDPILRYVMLLSIEINGRAVSSKFVEVADRSEKETGKRLMYFGRTHLERELGGLHGDEDVENEILEVNLDPETKVNALEIAMKTLEIQAVDWDEIGRSSYDNKMCKEFRTMFGS